MNSHRVAMATRLAVNHQRRFISTTAAKRCIGGSQNLASTTNAAEPARPFRRYTNNNHYQQLQQHHGLVNRRAFVSSSKNDIQEGEIVEKGPPAGFATSGDKQSDNDILASLKQEDAAKEAANKSAATTDSTVVVDAKTNESPQSSYVAPPKGETHGFKAETRQLLDIVTNSLYTDKEVFLRELVSNASDSLEKLRHLQATNQISAKSDVDRPLEIRIELDEVSSTLTLTDTGIGMTKDELMSNLGTIARSGSKAFVKSLSHAAGADASKDIIGKFGVGFYSSFMVGRKVEVRSKSARDDESPKIWSSDGSGDYEISELPEGVRQKRGSSVIIHFKDTHWDFVDEARIEKILKRYSNFVNFPIFLNGKLVNTQKALWSVDPKEVKEEEYTSFYKYITQGHDVPMETLHFRADAPIDIKALFFVPQHHSEKYGMERMQPGVSLYSRKILIQANSPDILPDWMRFVKGCVDSEDLPLAISREKTQDTALLGKLRRTLTRKFISHMAKMAKKDKTAYIDDFYKEYSVFLKEGVCHDFESQNQLSKILFFETNKPTEGGFQMISFDDYISRMRPEQKKIYYISAPTREAALNSPYLEGFDSAGIEVLFCFNAIEEFVMSNLEKYEGRELVSVERKDKELQELLKNAVDKKEVKKDPVYDADVPLTPEETLEFCAWFKTELGADKVGACTSTDRLTSSPAIVVDNESGAMRRMMRMMETGEIKGTVALPKQNVEINPGHKMVSGLYQIMKKEPKLANVVALQMFDNCLVAAGLLDDNRAMLPRLNDIMLCVVNGAKDGTIGRLPGDENDTSSTLIVDDALTKGSKSTMSSNEIEEASIVDKSDASSSDDKATPKKKTAAKKSPKKTATKKAAAPKKAASPKKAAAPKKTAVKKRDTKKSEEVNDE